MASWLLIEMSVAEKLLNFADDLNEAVNLIGGVVEIETRARRGLDAELFHERLVAMMPASQRHTALVGHRHHIVRVDTVEEEAH